MLPPVKFDRPPIIEVVCGVQFDGLLKLRVPQIGLFWAKLRKEFPEVEERPPLGTFPEMVGEASIELSNLPPLPRVWLMEKTGRHLVQIQRDRFLFNWKRVDAEDKYPSYKHVIKEFERHLKGFRQFLAHEELGDLVFRQFELTYVNHIGKENGLDVAGAGGLLIDHVRSGNHGRFLPEPSAFNWRSSYDLPDANGRLLVQCHTVSRKDERLVRLDLTARGIPNDNSDLARRPWFDLAHDWITHGFADITNPEVQRTVWGRTQ